MKTSSDITSARRRPVAAAAAAAAATVDIFKVLFSSPVLVRSIYHRFLPQHCPCAMCERTSACMCLRPCLFARPPLRTSSSLLLSPQTAAGACIRGRLSRHQHRTRPFTAVGVMAFDGRIDLRRHLANDYTIMHRVRPSDLSRLSSAAKNPRQRQVCFRVYRAAVRPFFNTYFAWCDISLLSEPPGDGISMKLATNTVFFMWVGMDIAENV